MVGVGFSTLILGGLQLDISSSGKVLLVSVHSCRSGSFLTACCKHTTVVLLLLAIRKPNVAQGNLLLPLKECPLPLAGLYLLEVKTSNNHNHNDIYIYIYIYICTCIQSYVYTCSHRLVASCNYIHPFRVARQGYCQSTS